MNGMEHIPETPQNSAPDAPSASPAISDAIEKLLANPDLLASVASAIGLGKTSTSPTASTAEPQATVADTSAAVAGENLPAVASTPPLGDLGDTVAAIAPLLSSLSGKGSPSKADDQRICLLRALKPYVSRGRAEAIDTIIQLSRVSELFKKLT